MPNSEPDLARSAEADRAEEAAELDSDRTVERSSTPTARDRSWTVEFEVRYLTGADGDRLAARQAEAIASLLSWVQSPIFDDADKSPDSSGFERHGNRWLSSSESEAA